MNENIPWTKIKQFEIRSEASKRDAVLVYSTHCCEGGMLNCSPLIRKLEVVISFNNFLYTGVQLFLISNTLEQQLV